MIDDRIQSAVFTGVPPERVDELTIDREATAGPRRRSLPKSTHCCNAVCCCPQPTRHQPAKRAGTYKPMSGCRCRRPSTNRFSEGTARLLGEISLHRPVACLCVPIIPPAGYRLWGSIQSGVVAPGPRISGGLPTWIMPPLGSTRPTSSRSPGGNPAGLAIACRR